jgi:cell division protease FtsH
MVQGPQEQAYSDETERLIDHAVRDLVGHAYERSLEILAAHREVHDNAAKQLLKKETFEEDDIEALRVKIAPQAAPLRAAAE